MPGIRSTGVRDPNWSRPWHDKLATGFSPLVCGMKTAPVVWSSIPILPQASSIRVVASEGHDDQLLVSDDRLRLVTADGKELWSRSPTGELCYCGDLHGDGKRHMLMIAGRVLHELDAKTGATLWSHSFEPQHVDLLVRVADILPKRKGLEAAVFLNHGEEGSVINFAPGTAPEFVWQRSVVNAGEFDERYDHHSGVELDLSKPDEPVIWNVRRHRCRGIDARTGQVISSLEYALGGEQRRNYGKWALGHDRSGSPLAVVLGESVQLHAHAIRLRREGKNELAWQHYYGEVYKDTPGAALAYLAIDDLDADEITEVAYSVRDPALDFRSLVRVRDAETGEVESELPDFWGAAVVRSQRAKTPSLILAYQALDGATPTQGQLTAFVAGESQLAHPIATFSNATLLNVQSDAQHEFFMREQTTSGNAAILRYHWNGTTVELVQELASETFRDSSLRAVLHQVDGNEVLVIVDTQGDLVLADAEGSVIAKLPPRAQGSATLSAADLDGDRRAELLISVSPGRLQAYSFADDGHVTLRTDYPCSVNCFGQGPVSYDLLGDGQPEILRVDRAADGRFEISAEQPGKEPLWRTKLDLFVDEVQGCVIHPGQFLASDHAAVAVSLTDERLVREGTYLIDGRNGEVKWFKSRYRDGATIMPYRPRGVPTAVDFDGDGIEEIGMDMLSYMAYLRGTDGEFVYLRHTKNIRTENAIYCGHLYNTFCPIYESDRAERPHWMVIGGFGPFGLMKPDPTEGIWQEDHGYDVPPKIGMVDVDGDGRMELGYAAYYDRTFVCRDLWTGKEEWTVELPFAPNGPTFSADFDGDGKGEFLIAGFCIGTNSTGKGELRWQAPHSMGWGAIADFDGDGEGEIACQAAGSVVILRAEKPSSQTAATGR
jgi:hypothetical protein